MAATVRPHRSDADALERTGGVARQNADVGTKWAVREKQRPGAQRNERPPCQDVRWCKGTRCVLERVPSGPVRSAPRIGGKKPLREQASGRIEQTHRLRGDATDP